MQLRRLLPDRAPSPEALLLLLLAAAYCAWILSLPVFPTQDSPVHLYYVQVLGDLLSAKPSVYQHFYYLKYALPPYSLYYYVLLGLSRLLPLPLADRLVVCGYVVLFLYGFRYLARAAGPNGDRVALLASLLLLNQPLGNGFLNFCLSFSLALWAMGLWLRFGGPASSAGHAAARRLLFLALVATILLTHPVPLLVVLAFCTAGVALRAAAAWRAGGLQRSPQLWLDVATLLPAALSLLYLRHFANQYLWHSPEQALPYLTTVRLHVATMPLGRGLAYFALAGWQTVAYRVLLLLLLPLSLALALWQFARNRAAQRPLRSELWLGAALAVAVVLPWLPTYLNGNAGFAERLVLLLWLAVLLAAAPLEPRPAWLRAAVMLFAVAGTGVVLWAAQRYVRPEALRSAAYFETPPLHLHQVGLLLTTEPLPAHPGDPFAPHQVSTSGLNFNPRLWEAAHYFRHNHAVLFNSPFLDHGILPPGRVTDLPQGQFSWDLFDCPACMGTLLQRSPAGADAMLSRVQFVFDDAIQPPSSASTLEAVFARELSSGRRWSPEPPQPPLRQFVDYRIFDRLPAGR